MTERLIIQRAITKEVLSYDLRGVSHGATDRQLSAVGTLPLKVGASQATRLASDGQPMFGEWETLVTLEQDAQIRFRGVVTAMSFDAPNWDITVSSIATYPHGIPYEDDLWYGAEIDPTRIVDKLWQHAQSFPDSNLGVTVVGSTPVRVGSLSTQRRMAAEVAYKAAVATYDARNKTLQAAKAVVAGTRKTAATKRTDRANASKAVTAASKAVTAAKTALTAAKKTKDQAKIAAAQNTLNQANATLTARKNDLTAATNALNSANGGVKVDQSDVDAKAKIVAAAKAAKDKASDALSAAKQAESDDGGAYTLAPWEAPDCGQLIDDLAKSTPFDWIEEHYWSGDVPQTRIRIVHPRVGRRLSGDSDPTFVQGVNITVALKPTSSGDKLANSAYGIGAGEGAGSLRRSITVRNGRLRRVASFQAKDVKKAQDLDAQLRVELTARQETLAVASITVANHPNSKRGTYGIGDDILVQGQVPHLGRFALWHRIVGLTENTNGTTDLDLERTDSFTYGQGVDA